MSKKFTEQNPALQFLTNPTDPDEEMNKRQTWIDESGTMRDPDGEITFNKIETKTKRVQLYLRPSTHYKAKQAANRKGISLNEYIGQMLDEQ